MFRFQNPVSSTGESVYVRGAGVVHGRHIQRFIDRESYYQLPVAVSDIRLAPIVWKLPDGQLLRTRFPEFPEPVAQVVESLKYALNHEGVAGRRMTHDLIVQLQGHQSRWYEQAPARQPGFRAIAQPAGEQAQPTIAAPAQPAATPAPGIDLAAEAFGDSNTGAATGRRTPSGMSEGSSGRMGGWGADEFGGNRGQMGGAGGVRRPRYESSDGGYNNGAHYGGSYGGGHYGAEHQDGRNRGWGQGYGQGYGTGFGTGYGTGYGRGRGRGLPPPWP
ncbi:hypothetical protein NA57DRAFT_70660 [Rhizodiscina lignyota]|uniref:Uncharacterized protein n=1 Tax=Rhizodiscina lignyota TaxID=1504668 RepID=A0A9P4MBA3_9PEZI|nr:hypothetical protein NA57DRAFT_70660 [Rhizodiscina lignyota]